MSIYTSDWTPRGVRNGWDRCSISNDNAQRILGEYAKGTVIDACAWFDFGDALRVLVADTNNGLRITYRRNSNDFSISIKRERLAGGQS